MRHCPIPVILLLALTCRAADTGPAGPEGTLDAFLGEAKMEMQQVFTGERFPNVVVARDGTVVGMWGSQSVRVRRSEDGGKTWQPPVTIADPGFGGGGAIVDEITGDILAFVQDKHPPSAVNMYRSKDHGKTWKKENLVIEKDESGSVPQMHMAEHGITLRRGEHAGRLLRPARVYGRADGYNNAIYSDDGGKTWRSSKPFPMMGTGEGAVAELSDGRIYYSSRKHWFDDVADFTHRRAFAWSRDGGQTWQDAGFDEQLPDGPRYRGEQRRGSNYNGHFGMMCGLTRLSVEGRDILLYSNADAPTHERVRMTVWASFDGGSTWPVKRLVHEGSGAYSSLAAGRHGTASEGWIFLLYEIGGAGARLARFNLAWLLGGEKTGDGQVPDGRAESPAARSSYLLLDSRIVDNVENAKLAIGTVTKHLANPLFGEDKAWEKRFDNLYANVIFDDQDKLYKCWYSPFIVDNSAKGMTVEQRKETRYRAPPGREMGICYATSRDGLKWDKPELGLVEFEGSKQNNILWRGPHGAGVFKDAHDPDPARRYKAFFQGINVAFSSDGIHWGKAAPCPEIKVAGDTHNNALWAPTLGKYVGITRTWGKQGRQVARTESDDFLKWTKADVVLEGLEKSHQTYAMPVFYHGGVYLGLVAIHQQGVDRVWTELTWSPDTITWHRVCPGTPLIANGEKEMDYDWGCVYAGAYPVFLDDEIRIYYGGSDGLHTSWRNGFLCMASLRPDGFAGYAPADANKPAALRLKPVTCTGGALRLTADAQAGEVRVRVLDADSAKGAQDAKVIARSRPISGDVTSAKVEWEAGFDLSAWKGKPIRLAFEFAKAKIYSFAFQE